MGAAINGATSPPAPNLSDATFEDGKAYAVTTPLLTKADGKSLESEEGNIWLDPNRTSAYKFYQFWINADDADISKYIRYFTLKTKQEVIDMEEAHKGNPRMLKQLLAEELTARVHSPEDLASVQKVTELLLARPTYDSPEALQQFSPAQLEMVKGEITYKEIPFFLLNDNVSVIDLISEHTGIVASKAEARKAIQNKAVSINKQKVEVIEHTVSSHDLLHSQYLMVENGKKKISFLVGVV